MYIHTETLRHRNDDATMELIFATQRSTFLLYEDPFTPKVCLAILTIVRYILEYDVLVSLDYLKPYNIYFHTIIVAFIYKRNFVLHTHMHLSSVILKYQDIS